MASTENAKAVKTLALGPFNGQLRECFDKVKNLNEKHGPFDSVFVVGDLFGDLTGDDEVVKGLLAGRIDVPCPTYFICGSKPLPNSVRCAAERNDGEVCPNLMFLGRQGLLRTSEGLRIAFLGGVFKEPKADTASDGSDGNAEAAKPADLAHYRETDVKSLMSTAKVPATAVSPAGVDILLTHEWPDGITNGASGTAEILKAINLTAVPPGSQHVAELSAVLQPRYHYAATPFVGDDVPHTSVFFEREPYHNEGANGLIAEKDIALHVTRFIGLGAQNSPVKTRWLHAMNIVPIVHASQTIHDSIPPNTTSCPLSLPVIGSHGVKRPAEDNFFYQGRPDSGKRRHPPDSYTCNKCMVKGHWIQDCPQRVRPGDAPHSKESHPRRPPPDSYTCNICNVKGHWKQECPRRSNRDVQPSWANNAGGRLPPLISEAECWFCLSSPQVSKHLLVSIGTELYLAMSRGQLTDPDPPKSLPGHVPGGGHVLIIPIGHYANFNSVPSDTKEEFEAELAKYKEALRKTYAKYDAKMVCWELCRPSPKQMHHHVQVLPVPNHLVDKVEHTFTSEAKISGFSFEPGERPDTDYFHVELPNGSSMVYRIPPRSRFNPQFGRQVLARVLDDPDRANWRNCAKDTDSETADTEAFKKAFSAFDFTLE